ncbi:MAG: ribokinase [Hellea sp.]|nr:ribokinase [Hellea sp.]
MAPKICVLGSVNLDLIIKTATLPKAGETIGGGSYESQPGGKGANIALAARRLGSEVELRAAVGSDSFAAQALTNLKEAGVDLSSLIHKDAHTGLAFINVDDHGENQIAVAAGANGAFMPDDLTPIEADALVTQFEIPQETVLAAVKSFDGLTCLNASPVIEDLSPFLPHIDLLILNESEYEAYGQALDHYHGLMAVTFGAKGANLFREGDLLVQDRPPAVHVVDTTGAGDSFAAALTLALIEGQSPSQALNFACTVGALATTRLGAQASCPSREMVATVNR